MPARPRFRPCVDFRPGFDLLMPRIVPSDLSTLLAQNPTPDDPDPVDPGDPGAPTIPPATVSLYPTDTGTDTSGTTSALLATTISTQTVCS